MRPFLLQGVLLISFLSCSNKDDIESFMDVDVTKYNARISEWKATGEINTSDPILITRELFRYDDPERKTIIDFETKTFDNVRITLTQEGLSDDSAYGEKRIIDLQQVNNNWIIQRIRLGFKCQKNRGHTNYSGYLCN